MPLRLLEYVVQIFKLQTREWSRKQRSFAGIHLQPVLPVVFYTGTRCWDKIGRLVDLVEMGQRFREVTPILDPLFINLSAMQPAKLESEGGFFGWVLRLLQERKLGPMEFDELIKRVVQHLESMPGEERLRWLELLPRHKGYSQRQRGISEKRATTLAQCVRILRAGVILSYIQALVYHDRNRSEHRALQATIESSVQADQGRQEVSRMFKSMADVLIEKGQRQGLKKGRKQGEIRALQRTLLHLLGERFGELPQETVQTIKSLFHKGLGSVLFGALEAKALTVGDLLGR
jgi:hypothetical protein